MEKLHCANNVAKQICEEDEPKKCVMTKCCRKKNDKIYLVSLKENIKCSRKKKTFIPVSLGVTRLLT